MKKSSKLIAYLSTIVLTISTINVFSFADNALPITEDNDILSTVTALTTENKEDIYTVNLGDGTVDITDINNPDYVVRAVIVKAHNDITRITWLDMRQLEIPNYGPLYKVGGAALITSEAFADCTNLTFVDLYNYSGSINSRTFANCINLEKIILNHRITGISQNAFEGCDKDKLVIYCESGTPAEKFAIENGYKYRIIESTPYDIYLESKMDDLNFFRVGYYIEHNPEVKEKFENDYDGARYHYLTEGYYDGLATIDPAVVNPTTTEETTTESTTESITDFESSTETTTSYSRGGGGGGGGSSEKTTTTTTEATTEVTTEETTKTEVTIEETTESSLNVRVTIGKNTVEIGDKSYIIDALPYIQSSSNSTLVPLRFVALAINGNDIESADTSSNISWDAISKTATISVNGDIIKFTADSEKMTVNDESITMENGVKAEIKDGRMYVPFRALGNAMGVEVEWDSATKTAIYKI